MFMANVSEGPIIDYRNNLIPRTEGTSVDKALTLWNGKDNRVIM